MNTQRLQTVVGVGLLVTVGIAGFLAFYATDGQMFKTDLLSSIKAEATKYAPLPDLAQKITGIETTQLKARHKIGNDALTAATVALAAGNDTEANANMNSAVSNFLLSEYLKTEEGAQVFAKVNADAKKTSDIINSAGELLNKYKGDDKDLLLLSHQGVASIYAQKVADNIGKEDLLNTLNTQVIVYTGLAKDILPSLAAAVKDADLADAVSNYDFVYKKTVVLDIKAPALKTALDALNAEFAEKFPKAAEAEVTSQKQSGSSELVVPTNTQEVKKPVNTKTTLKKSAKKSTKKITKKSTKKKSSAKPGKPSSKAK